jgi:hypothetical protein
LHWFDFSCCRTVAYGYLGAYDGYDGRLCVLIVCRVRWRILKVVKELKYVFKGFLNGIPVESWLNVLRTLPSATLCLSLELKGLT